MDAERSMVSRILRMVMPAPAGERSDMRRSNHERRLQCDRDGEREPADIVDSFVWSWQFPGQW